MYNTIPDILRRESIKSLFETPTFQNSWPIWKSKIQSIIGTSFNENDLLNLGDHLTEIFECTGTEGRGQGSLSGGGVAWESLVCFYVNLCTVGTRTVAIRKMSLVPKPIQHAITVNYGNFACNTESDITVIVCPNTDNYNVDIDEAGELNNKYVKQIPIIKKGKVNFEAIDLLCSRDFNQFEIGVIQCKTNWNDNAQIPMLWDMIYSSNGFRGRNITVGREGFNIHQAHNFTYSFVTAPSNRRANYTSNSVAVKRVTNLSGGNYWGKPSIPNIARSIKEIFINNYQNGAKSDLRQDLRSALPHLANSLNYFNII